MDIIILALIVCIILYILTKINKGKIEVEPTLSKKEEEKPKEEESEEPKEEEVVEEEESEEEEDDLTKLNKISSKLLNILDKFEEKAAKYGKNIEISTPKDELPEELRKLKEEYEKLKEEENKLFTKIINKK